MSRPKRSIFRPFLDADSARDINDAIDGIDDEIVGGITSVIEATIQDYKKFKIVPSHDLNSRSDGTMPRRYNDIAYSFTIEYPRTITIYTVVKIDLGRIRIEAAKAASRDALIIDPAGFDQAFDRIDFSKPVRDTFSNFGGEDGKIDYLPDKLLEQMEDVVEQNRYDSIDAWTEEKGSISLGEYPNVYVRWDFRVKKYKIGEIVRQGDILRVPFQSPWEVDLSRWDFDSDRLWGRR